MGHIKIQGEKTSKTQSAHVHIGELIGFISDLVEGGSILGKE